MKPSSVTGFLDSLRGKKVYFDALHGNHGDRLLLLAARSMIEAASLTLVDTPQSSDLILINGGGSMADRWFGLERLGRYCDRFPSHPLAVLPSSFYPEHSRLADIVRHRQAPLWLWAREQPSLEMLEDAGFDDKVTLGIDHDLALSLAHHPDIRKLEDVSGQGNVLIVERDDWEGPTGRRRQLSPAGLEFIPENIRTVVRKTLLGPLRKRQDRLSPFREAALCFVNGRHPETSGLEHHVADISLAETCGFEEFLQAVAGASVIVSTRLHVAILGHLLGRETYLVDGSYHKFRGVFDYSLRGGSTRLLSWDDHGQELHVFRNEAQGA